MCKCLFSECSASKKKFCFSGLMVRIERGCRYGNNDTVVHTENAPSSSVTTFNVGAATAQTIRTKGCTGNLCNSDAPSGMC